MLGPRRRSEKKGGGRKPSRPARSLYEENTKRGKGMEGGGDGGRNVGGPPLMLEKVEEKSNTRWVAWQWLWGSRRYKGTTISLVGFGKISGLIREMGNEGNSAGELTKTIFSRDSGDTLTLCGFQGGGTVDKTRKVRFRVSRTNTWPKQEKRGL